MARASTVTRQLSDEERQSIDATNQQLMAQQTDLSNTVTSAYQNMLANPGYTQSQQAAITGATQGADASAFDALAQNATESVARTNNSAGTTTLSINSRAIRRSNSPLSRNRIKSHLQIAHSKTN